jgi:hypothetical protein
MLSLFSFLFAEEAEEKETAMQEPMQTTEVSFEKEMSVNNLLITRKFFPYISAGAVIIIPQGSVGIKYFLNQTSAFDLQGSAILGVHGDYIYFSSLEFQYHFSQKTNPNPLSKFYLGGGLILTYSRHFHWHHNRYMPMPKLSIGVQFYQPKTQKPNLFVNLSTSIYLFPALNIGYLF